jgi:hypothetical protein
MDKETGIDIAKGTDKFFDSVTKCKGPISKINKTCIIISALNVPSA